mgnify:CR=1 FL=1
MKSLLARLRRLWNLAGCQHPKSAEGCFTFVVPSPHGGMEQLHFHCCTDCGLCTRFTIEPTSALPPVIMPLGPYRRPPAGGERFN